MLRRIYRGSVALQLVRVVEGRAGLFSLNDQPFTLGNRIYTKDSDLSDFSVMVHECAHVWQHQHEGTRYIGGALLAAWVLSYDAYEWEVELKKGRAWRDFNKEAQAEFLEEVFEQGKGAAGIPGLGAFYEDDPIGPAVQFQSAGADITDFARASVADMRAA